MTDNPKLLLISKIGLHIAPTCLSCKHGSFQINADEGLCTTHNYNHKGTQRPGPAHACFCCDSYEQVPNIGRVLDIGVYGELLPVGRY